MLFSYINIYEIFLKNINKITNLLRFNLNTKSAIEISTKK